MYIDEVNKLKIYTILIKRKNPTLLSMFYHYVKVKSSEGL